ncbi:uncharacterized protein [Polyergus mexicanus]|uniref:uncharacterized protein n=1 Tax=Polyergus mexicanus TaxID=615972 RepID=UPI0038B4FCBC
MADQIKLLIQKRTSLKSQITSMTNLVERGRYDKTALKLRMTRVTELYHAYEEFNDELILLDPNDQHKDEFANVQERFYSLASMVEGIVNSTTSAANAGTSSNVTQPSGSGAAAITKRRVKLPEASLPNFDGRYENWLSFKNTFLAMIDTQTDLSEVEKLQYLKSALKGEAANKIKILSVEGSNYLKAWELLKRSYEQHVALAALGVNVGSEILVNVLESKLPRNTAEKWEETLDRDEFPKIDDLYEFLYRTAVRVSKRVRETSKRDDDKFVPPFKKGRMSNKAFIVDVTNNCTACKNKQHPLFKCAKFKQLTVPKRIEFVRNAMLCYNCLRSHRGKACNYTNCTICQKRHNTLLHLHKNTAVPATTNATETQETQTA